MLQEATLAALEVIRDEVTSLFDRRSENPGDVDGTLRNLFAYMSERGQTVSFLLSWGYSWDAEIVLRAYYEVAARILFFCLSEPAEQEELLREFWLGLGAIGDRRRSIKAGFAGKAMKAGMGMDDPVFSALQDPDMFETEPQGTKAERNRLEQKWSFAQIIEVLSRKRVPGKRLDLLKGLLHSYGTASHLLHGDRTALDLMHDRATRDPFEAAIVARAHVARMMGNQVNLAYFCADALRSMCQLDFDDMERLHAAYREAATLGDEIAAEFYESQRDFYSAATGE